MGPIFAPAGALLRVRLEGDVALAALTTRRSATAFGLVPGREVVARIEPAALHAFPTAKASETQAHP
ncbi:MAG TPA: TOBE domain-containing protein [Longimicrobiales bacterium]